MCLFSNRDVFQDMTKDGHYPEYLFNLTVNHEDIYIFHGADGFRGNFKEVKSMCETIGGRMLDVKDKQITEMLIPKFEVPEESLDFFRNLLNLTVNFRNASMSLMLCCSHSLNQH